MRIKLMKKVTVAGHTDPVPKGAVIESDNEGHIAEYKALIASGLAKSTNEAPSDPNTFLSVGGNTPKVSGIRAPEGNDQGDDEPEADEYDTILAGTIPEVTEALAGKDEAFLAELGRREEAGQGRVGVAKAIEAATAALGAE